MSLARTMLLITVAVCFLFKSTWGSQNRNFPAGFKFGAASSSYQIEGGWNADDKTESIWDVHTHTRPDLIIDRSTGDVACDSYNQWERDIEIAAELGLDFYRFSISWPRILPTGFPNKISDAGTKYYNNLINGLLARGIEPVVTIYHWELPERIQKLGGWTNPLIADWFADFARVAYNLFGDRVKTWITINEPILICDTTYNTGLFAPPNLDPAISSHICSKNVLLGHAKAYRIYDEEFRSEYKGEVGITNQFIWMTPLSEKHEELAKMALELSSGLYCHPIFSKEGGWPPSIEKYIAEKSKKEGYTRSRLPAFTQYEKELVRGSYDFLGFNYYTSRIVKKTEPGETVGNWPLYGSPDLEAKLIIKPEWPRSGTTWFAMYPEGIRHMLVWIKKQYGDIKILITENGYPSSNRTHDDVERIQYYKDHLEQFERRFNVQEHISGLPAENPLIISVLKGSNASALLAIKEDGVNIVGYTAWTLMDNFEWIDGYSVKFGLYDVDFTDPARPRTARSSARYYANVIQRRSLDITTHISDEL